MWPPAKTITMSAAPIASGAITPVPAPITVQPIVRTRKNVPMNSAIYLFIDQFLADTVWKRQETSAMRLCSYRPLLRSNLINVDTAIDFIRVETSTIKTYEKTASPNLLYRVKHGRLRTNDYNCQKYTGVH